ncbi:MAG: LamG domain-containing protein [Tyzzerella sp.]|nr:LamG domain-containing protein [Tyzzerella sp.]
MKKLLKKTLAAGLAATLLCTNFVVGYAAESALKYSCYSFDGGSYENGGSQSMTDKVGTEIGTYTMGALPGEGYITDHTDSVATGLAKGFTATNAVEVPNDALTFDTFTASAWFSCQHIDGLSNAGTIQRIMSNGGYNAVGGWYVSVLVQNNGNTYIGCNIGGASGKTEFIDVTATKGIYLGNTWHNVMLVADRANNTAYVYLDGEELVHFDTTDSWYNDAATNAYIGGYKDSGNVVEGFCGFISDVQSVNRAMTPDQVAAYCGEAVTDSTVLLADQFQNGTPGGTTGDAGSGTTGGATGGSTEDKGQETAPTQKPSSDSGITHYTFDSQKDEAGVASVGNVKYEAGRSGKSGDYALSLDGNSYLKLDAKKLAFDGSFTVAFWMKMPNGGTKYDSVQRVFSTGVWGAGENGFMVGLYNCTKGEKWSKLLTGVGSSNPTMNWSEATELLDDGKWHQVTATFNGGNKKVNLYFDGQLAGTYDYPADGNTVTGYANTAIGGHLDAEGVFAEGFKGLLDDVFVVNRALSTSEVQTLVKANVVSGVPKTFDGATTPVYIVTLFVATVAIAGYCVSSKRKVKGC